MNDQSPNKLAELLLLAVKMEKDHTTIRSTLKSLNFEAFYAALDNDKKKKAFWINIYNATYQILRKENNLVKPAIYKNKEMEIAGKLFSLDDMEHCILRKNKTKFSFGLFKTYLRKR